MKLTPAGCRALRSTGLSDISLNPTALEQIPSEVLRECLDIFHLDNVRHFWPESFDTLEKLALLSRRNVPTSNEDVDNVTLDTVDAFVQSDHQVCLT